MKNGKWKIIFGEIKNRSIEENWSMKSGSFPNLDEDICETGEAFWPWLASGAPLGPWPPPWRPFLDFSGRISGLGSSLGSFLGASVCFLVCFYCFSTSHGIIFSKFQA